MEEQELAKVEILPVANWVLAPEKVYRMARKNSAEGMPTGIGIHPTFGWVILESSGQGSYLIWKEKDGG
jgi:hypothetical protein